MKIPFIQKLKHGRFETHATEPMNVHSATQVHGTDIVSVETLPCEADGLVASWDDMGKPLAIKTADCMPIVVEGCKGVVFLHAGWKGLALGILKKPEISLIGPEIAFIGPSIRVCCFEVSEDFKENFPHNPNFIQKGDKFFFNLQEEAKRQIRMNFPNLEVVDSGECTMCNDAYHSYRRDKNKLRNWNIYLKG
jgi:polyphenol oxidase